MPALLDVEWIDVKEKWPERGVMCIVWRVLPGYQKGRVTIGSVQAIKFREGQAHPDCYWWYPGSGSNMVLGVSHWMPLPAPPHIVAEAPHRFKRPDSLGADPRIVGERWELLDDWYLTIRAAETSDEPLSPAAIGCIGNLLGYLTGTLTGNEELKNEHSGNLPIEGTIKGE